MLLRCRILLNVISRRFDAWAGRPYLMDSLMALMLFALHMATVYSRAQADPAVRWPPDWFLVLEVLTIGPLVFRRRFPKTVYTLVYIFGLSLTFPHYRGEIIGIVALIALYSVCVYEKRAWAFVATALAFPWAFGPYLLTERPHPTYWILSAIVHILATAAFGLVRRRGMERAAELERAREQLAREAVLVERGRIARELHDIVAHGISLIAVRAGVARALLPGDPGQAQESIGVIEKVARESLGEMRHMLTALRCEGDTEELGPQPGLHRLDDLAEAARTSGLDVELIRHGESRALPPGHELAAYRIIQEALTNVVKHAGPVRTTVTLDYRRDSLVVDVFNEAGPPRLSTVDSGGHGLMGMRERATLYGGTVHAHPVTGGFRVTAELPLAAEVLAV